MCSVASVVSDSVNLRTAAHQAPLSMGFSRQEYWSGLPRPLTGDRPNPGVEPKSPASPALQADSLSPSYWRSPRLLIIIIINDYSLFLYLSACRPTRVCGSGLVGRVYFKHTALEACRTTTYHPATYLTYTTFRFCLVWQHHLPLHLKVFPLPDSSFLCNSIKSITNF